MKSKKGRIVSEKWIYDSFNQKKLLSWKRLAFLVFHCISHNYISNNSYVFGQSSDDEEEDDNDVEEDEDYVPPVLNNRKRIQYIDDDEDGSQIKEVIGFRPNDAPNEPQNNDNDTNDEIYDMETDESSGADNNTIPNNNNSEQNQNSKSQTIDIFKGKCFCLFGAFDDKEKQLLNEYIISHYGFVFCPQMLSFLK